MTAKRELSLATAFFALLAVLVVGLMRPLDTVGWACLATSVTFVVLGCLALWKDSMSAASEPGSWTVDQPFGGDVTALAPTAVAPEELISAAQAGEPTNEERVVLKTTIEALVEADALAPGEVDVMLLWRAAQHVDPGRPVGSFEALYALATLQEFGLFAPRRLVFVPSHTEYDTALLAEITASVLMALGHGVGPDDVIVVLPGEGAQGRASITFPLDGRRETIMCDFLWKYPPPDLCEALINFRRADDPREVVCADGSHGMLLLAAIRPGSLDALNRRFPAEDPLFGPP
ncbi:hypothetical protein [Methylobacterium aquaticum]|uniref:Uncharacterized protein n=1 Tax=Methylobacterium aquaticum TaxID=270351 RepID=A0A0J6T6B5_9HYPH|nr:hypothetical protein [Methylobacterium aquaticum]KMO41372.1 hypothetical protein VP06_00820 [Methylobacterium aquaticum]